MTNDYRWIEDRLSALEASEEIRILFACESGSRAWGFPSADSDFDVRFVYVHPREAYLSLKPVQETIDILDGDFDAGGWDIRKALALMRGGNVPILEWLFSPIMYRCDDAIVASLRDLASHVFLPHRAVYHYAAMGKKKLREMNEQPPTLKVAFYALRAALSARYVSETERIAPVAIDTVLERFLSADDKQVVDDWRAQKALGKEADNVGDVAYWQRLCAEHLDVAEAVMPANRDKAAYAEFDTLLLGLLG